MPFADALALVLAHGRALARSHGSEKVPLLASAGRTLAREVRAERDQPPFARSTRDGFAVRSDDLHEGNPLQIVGSVRAGEAWTGASLAQGQALEIMTGAPLPRGADAVLMIEHTTRDADRLRPQEGRQLQTGENVVAQGAEARAFAEVVPAGRRIGASEIAVAAACGYARLETFQSPRVAIVATGDELVELGVGSGTEAGDEASAALLPGQIRNSNSYALAALVTEEGGMPVRLAIARDTREQLGERLREAQRHDLILFSGGVSMGRYDLVEPVLAESGAEFLFTGALIQPGKPVVFGRLPRYDSAGQRVSESSPGWTYFFGLPGNPVSTEVCFRLFAAPLLRALCGRTKLAPSFIEARLAEDLRGGAKVTRFLPATVTGDWQRVEVRPVPWQGSGDLAANARADGFVVLPAEVPHFEAGATVRVLLR